VRYELGFIAPKTPFCIVTAVETSNLNNGVVVIYEIITTQGTASVVWWPEFLATAPEVPGSILDATRFSE
jgi:hypothetical protein